MPSIKALDAAIAQAAKNSVISYKEAAPIVELAKKVVAASGNKSRTQEAVLDRFNKIARQHLVKSDRVVGKIASAVKELTDNEKTFTLVGIRSKAAKTSTGSSSVRRGGGKSTTSTSRSGGGKSSSSTSRSGGGKSGSSAPVRRPSPIRTGGSKSSSSTGRTGGRK